jgi:hypothetical protein
MAYENLATFTFTQVLESGEVIPQSLWRKTPAVLKFGSKNVENGGFFDYDLILDVSDKNRGSNLYDEDGVLVVQDQTTKEIGIFIKSSIFITLINNHIVASFDSEGATSLNNQFNSQIATAVNAMPSDDRYVQILASQFEPGSAGTDSQIIQRGTASIDFSEFPGIAFDENGNERIRKLTIDNNSVNYTDSYFYFNAMRYENDLTGDNIYDNKQEEATNALVTAGKSHLTRSFEGRVGGASAKNSFFYIQPKPIPEWSIQISSSHYETILDNGHISNEDQAPSPLSTGSYWALTSSFSSSADYGVTSGSTLGYLREMETIPFNAIAVNSVDSKDGMHVGQIFTGAVEEEGETNQGEDNQVTNNLSFLENKLSTPVYLIRWPHAIYTYSDVRSGSFYYTPYPDLPFEQITGEVLRDTITGSIATNEESGSGQLITLYWIKHSYTSSFTGSFGMFNRTELEARTGDASYHQYPYMSHTFTGASLLYTDKYCSKPAGRGFYVHSSSFSQASKNQMSASWGSNNHTSSFYVMGVFSNPYFVSPPLGYPAQLIGYTSSQHNDPEENTNTWRQVTPKPSTMFLKRYDDIVKVSNSRFRPFAITSSTVNVPSS